MTAADSATVAPDAWAMLRLVLVALLVAAPPLWWWWRRQRGAGPQGRLAVLTAITLFLTLDLIVFGAFTRLTDSGLGCPDWPGCYGHASPVGARGHIAAEVAVRPDGPVTVAKAWIEMLHRYLAMGVGLLIMLTAALAWRARHSLPHSPAWALLTLVWVVVQGLFGRWTVTLKLYPAIVTLHLLGALLLLGMLVAQHESLRRRPLALPGVRPAHVALVLALLVVQVALGGWVSTNYAVLACQGWPQCNGQWWPAADWSAGFELLRPLGQQADGGWLPFDALVAVHLAHRTFAWVAAAALVALVVALARSGQADARRLAAVLGALLAAQVLSGVSNVVLGWPIAAALAHSAGAAVMVGLLVALLVRLRLATRAGHRAAAPLVISSHRPGHVPAPITGIAATAAGPSPLHRPEGPLP